MCMRLGVWQVAGCAGGAYAVEIFATLSAQYKVHVLVNDVVVSGSPFSLSIRPLTVNVVSSSFLSVCAALCIRLVPTGCLRCLESRRWGW